ncbi:hypothetical protein BDF21DRAFT_420353 [Thamnidium elegans]|nr:hypothetical protein BDF21DRAFT_420353 [Thamnidium elegans]
MRLLVEELMKKSDGNIKDMDAFHYVLVVPSEWDEDIREVLLRPMFVQSNLISQDDHKDRLVFYSDVESICCSIEDTFNGGFYLEREKNIILCRLSAIKKGEILIKLNLVSNVNSLFDFSNMICPKVVRYNPLVITTDDIICGIRAFIDTKISIDIQEEIMRIIMETNYNYILSDTNEKEERTINLKKPIINDTSKWELDKNQEVFMRSICLFDICAEIGKNKFNNVKDLVLNNCVKEYKLVIFIDTCSSEIYPDQNLLNWSKYMLEYNRISFNAKNVTYKSQGLEEKIDCSTILLGAKQHGCNTLRNSAINSKVRIIPVQGSVISSSVFLDSGPDAIITIDISLDSTLLSLTLLDENGVSKEIFSHDYFIANRSLNSLGSFFRFSEVTTLDVNHSFIKFAEEYLMGDISDRNEVLLGLIDTKIESIFHKDGDVDDLLASTQQHIYIKAFILLYMIYLKNVISSKLSAIVESYVDVKIGYDITIEKILLCRLFDTKECLKDIIYASGLIQKDDCSKKLRIITQGERLLPLFQQSLSLPLPLKSFFVVAQLHEDYIQLTLNQVVTESSLEENQQAIIVDDEIIHIPNIYDSLCLNMWNSIVQDISLIKPCTAHKKYSGNELLEVFSLENRAEFASNLQKYISKNNFYVNLNQKMTIRLSVSCNCKVCFMVTDLLDISFRPLLQKISSLVSHSLINEEYFGRCRSIIYVFYLIHFNYNTQFQDAVIKILKEITEDVMIEEGINIPHYVIPKSLNQLLQPVLQQQPFSYKEFRKGVLRQVCSENYGYTFMLIGSNRNIVYKSKITDSKTVLIDDRTVFPFLKKGDAMIDCQTKRIVYLNPQEISGENTLYICYSRLRTLDGLNPDGTVSLENISEDVLGTVVYRDMNNFSVGQYIPVAISIRYEADGASLCFGAKVAGERLTTDSWYELAAPVTLSLS